MQSQNLMVQFFFDNESDFKATYERNWADKTWEEMDEETLQIWINRLSNENDPDLQNWVIRNKIKKTLKNNMELF